MQLESVVNVLGANASHMLGADACPRHKRKRATSHKRYTQRKRPNATFASQSQSPSGAATDSAAHASAASAPGGSSAGNGDAAAPSPAIPRDVDAGTGSTSRPTNRRMRRRPTALQNRTLLGCPAVVDARISLPKGRTALAQHSAPAAATAGAEAAAAAHAQPQIAESVEDMQAAAPAPSTQLLPTHVWHAKRQHMESTWGWLLPQHAVGKGRAARSHVRHAKQHAVLHDASYCARIVISGGVGPLERALRCIVTAHSVASADSVRCSASDGHAVQSAPLLALSQRSAQADQQTVQARLAARHAAQAAVQITTAAAADTTAVEVGATDIASGAAQSPRAARLTPAVLSGAAASQGVLVNPNTRAVVAPCSVLCTAYDAAARVAHVCVTMHTLAAGEALAVLRTACADAGAAVFIPAVENAAPFSAPEQQQPRDAAPQGEEAGGIPRVGSPPEMWAPLGVNMEAGRQCEWKLVGGAALRVTQAAFSLEDLAGDVAAASAAPDASLGADADPATVLQYMVRSSCRTDLTPLVAAIIPSVKANPRVTSNVCDHSLCRPCLTAHGHFCHNKCPLKLKCDTGWPDTGPV